MPVAVVGEVRALTRGGYDWTKKFAAIIAEARELGHASMIIDGEAVVLDDQGRSDFGLLQRAVGKKQSLHDAGEIIFYAFDLLYLDGGDLRGSGYLQLASLAKLQRVVSAFFG